MRGLLQRNYVYLIILVISTQFACTKVSNISIDNDNLVRTPYSLYTSNLNGAMFNTNNGDEYKMIFPADGSAMKAIITCKTNLLFIKENLHFSENNGKNFFMVYNKVNPQPWQEQIVDVPLQNRMYVASTEGQGVAFSADNGKTWQRDDSFNALMPPNYDVTSFAAMNDGSVYGFSNISLMLIKKDNADAVWNPVTIEGIFPADDGEYFLSGDGTSLFLIDYSGEYSNYRSDDGGTHWTRFTRGELTQYDTNYTVARAPGGPMLIGNEQGIYKQEGDRFVMSSGGLELGTKVYRIVVKKNIYKNDKVQYFMFASTSKGMYRSEDRGYNWKRVTDTTFSYHYNAMY